MEDMKINDQEPEENRGYAVLGKENVKKERYISYQSTINGRIYQ